METGTPTNFNKPKEKTPWIGYVIIGLIILVLVSMCGDDDEKKSTTSETKTEEKLELTEYQDSLIRSIEYDGHIEIKLFDNEVWVTPLFWNTCDYNAKRNLAYFCAIKCANAQNETLYYCTIRNTKDGKKLGKYSHAWGFEVE